LSRPKPTSVVELTEEEEEDEEEEEGGGGGGGGEEKEEEENLNGIQQDNRDNDKYINESKINVCDCLNNS
jgi:hypothetical protein